MIRGVFLGGGAMPIPFFFLALIPDADKRLDGSLFGRRVGWDSTTGGNGAVVAGGQAANEGEDEKADVD